MPEIFSCKRASRVPISLGVFTIPIKHRQDAGCDDKNPLRFPCRATSKRGASETHLGFCRGRASKSACLWRQNNSQRVIYNGNGYTSYSHSTISTMDYSITHVILCLVCSTIIILVRCTVLI